MFKTIPWETILKDYWAQIILLLGAIGYLVKLYLESRNKKKEIKFNLFYQQKLTLILNFYSTYYVAERKFNEVVGHVFSLVEDKNNKIDEEFIPVFNNFYHSFSQLKAFYDSENLTPYESVFKNLDEGKNKLIQFAFQVVDIRFINGQLYTKMKNEFQDFIEEKIIVENTILFKTIYERTRNEFGAK